MTNSEPSQPPGGGSDPPTHRRREVLTAIGMAGFAGYGIGLGGRGGRSRSLDGEWRREAKLTASDAESGAAFGISVALDGDRALVGARFDSETAKGAGAAYVFEFDDGDGAWNQVQKLTPSDAERLDEFGYSVALDGTRALVGAPGGIESAEGDGGNAYVFEQRDNGSWPATEDWKLGGSDVGSDDNFGFAVALDGPHAIATDPGFGSDSTGAAYVFEQRENGSWPATEAQKLVPDDAGVEDQFGFSVAIDAPSALVGAPRSFETDSTDGATYEFSRHQDREWREDGKLLVSDTDPTFGSAVAVDGASAVVGAWGDDERADNAGAVYFVGPLQPRKLTASDAGPGDLFGVSVALDGTRALVGAAGDFDRTNVVGAAYRFDVTSDQPNEQQRLTVPDVEPEDKFGWAVALDGGRALVSAFADNENGAGAGAVHVFSSPSPDPTPTDERTDVSTPTDEETQPATRETPTPDGNGENIPGLSQLSGSGFVGFAVGFLTGNAKDKEIKKRSLGLLTVVFGGSGLFGLIQQSRSVGWLVVAGVIGVVIGVVTGTVLRKLGLSFAA